MADISGFGLVVRLVASTTFPTGIDISSFADDADPFDLPSLQIADKAMGMNGDMVSWGRANPVTLTMAVIPNSVDDLNLSILLEANRPQRGAIPALDEITVTGIYPNGAQVTYYRGVITDGIPGAPVASAGRLKSKPYVFAFEGSQRS